MKKIKNIIFTFLLIGLTYGFFSPVALATEENVLNKFNLQAVPSEHQIDPQVSYFDLLLKPKATETLVVDLENNSKEELKIEASINRAITNQNGVVEYSGANDLNDGNGEYNISDLVTLDEHEIVLAPGEKKELKLTVKMPTKEFLGVIAGALYVVERPQGEAQGAVRNILSRELAILLRTKEDQVEPELLFHQAEATQDNGRNAIKVELENTSPTYIKDINLTYEVKHEGQSFLTGENQAVKIAPNTMFPFVIPLGEKEFEPGDYTVTLNLVTGEKKWEETLDFKVERKVAKELNQTDVSNDSATKIPWSTIILVSVLIVFAALAIYLTHKNQKLKKVLLDEGLVEKNQSKTKKRQRKRKSE